MTAYFFRLAYESLNAWIARRREAKAAYHALCHQDFHSRLPRHGTRPQDYRAERERAAARRVSVAFTDREK